MEGCFVNSHFVVFVGFFQYPAEWISPRGLKKLGEQYQPWFTRLDKKEIADTFNFLPSYFYASFNNAFFPEMEFTRSGLGAHDSGGDGSNPIDLNAFVSVLPSKDKPLHLTLIQDGMPEQIRVSFKERELACLVEYVDVFLYPRGEGLFSLKVRLSHDQEDRESIENISALTCALREYNTLIRVDGDRPTPAGDWLDALLTGCCPKISFRRKVSSRYYNNKLKAFCVLEMGENALPPKALDHLLYEVGTVSPIGSSSKPGIMKPAEEYFQQILEQNRITVFDNWSGLSLFDTFTILIHQPQQSLTLMRNAEFCYLPVYIHNLYLKLILFKTNAEISSEHILSRKNLKLRDWFVKARSNYDLSQVSYNFLPNLINNRIRFSLGIGDEIQFMESKVETLNTYIMEKQEKRTNRVLVFLSLLAGITAARDLSEWLQKLAGFKVSEYPLISGGMGSFVLFAVVILLLWGRRK